MELGDYVRVGSGDHRHHPSWNGTVGKVLRIVGGYVRLAVVPTGDEVSFRIEALESLSPLEQLAYSMED